jgi:hypothetical protein
MAIPLAPALARGHDQRVLSPEGPRWAAVAVCAIALAPVLSGCSLLGHGDGSGTSVFDVKAGQCFAAPTAVKAQISHVDRVSCAGPHDREVYATVSYPSASGSGGSSAKGDYPGDSAVASFAQGACAQRFGSYVGVSYLDSSLFFTYLAPSARSWQDDDRTVLCFVTAAGRQLKGSVKGSKQ